jgi:phage RecT family recombinase
MSNQVSIISEKPVFALLNPRASDIMRNLGNGDAKKGELMFKKEVSFAIQAANSNDLLATCDPASIAKAVYNVSITGLSLNPVKKLAYLVPKNIKGKWEAVLMPSYQGLAHLIIESGAVSKIGAYCVYEGDEFEYSYGFDIQLKHIPKGKSKTIVSVYGFGIAPSGEKYLEVMSIDEINEIKSRSDSGKKDVGPWKTDFAEMARKTVIRRLYKYLPKTEKMDKVAEAISIDEEDYPATIGQISYIESLLQNSNIDHEERASYERELSEMTHGRAQDVIEMLKENQLDPIQSGTNYSSTDISKKIQTEITLSDDND